MQHVPISDILEEVFPYIEELDACMYEQEPYKSNGLRKTKVMILLSTMRNYDKFRELPKGEQYNIAKKIENSCLTYVWNKTKELHKRCSWKSQQFKNFYTAIIYEKSLELDINHNKFLLPKIMDGTITKICELKYIDENPDFYQDMMSKNETRKQQQITRKTTTLYTCPMCAQKMCTYRLVQIRSMDEGKDVLATCVYCDWEWLVSRDTQG
jgi:DNA-directed RNA polymerase subunit M/transcription elongation factor TFIIS